MERQRIEWETRRAENEKIRREKEIEEERLRKEQEEKKRLETEKKAEENRLKRELFEADLKLDFSLITDRQIKDENGNRWLQCVFCGKKSLYDKDFSGIEGGKKLNLGTCKVCDKDPDVIEKKRNIRKREIEERKQNVRNIISIDINKCPECSGMLQKKSGQFGIFWGCVNYPRCRYIRKI